MDRLIRKTKSLSFLQTRTPPLIPSIPTPRSYADKLEHEIDTMLAELDSMPRVYHHKNPTFLQTFLHSVDEKTTQILNNRHSP